MRDHDVYECDAHHQASYHGDDDHGLHGPHPPPKANDRDHAPYRANNRHDHSYGPHRT